MLTVQSLVSSDAQDALRQKQLKKYYTKAQEFLATQFPVFGKTLSDDEQRAFVMLAYDRARQLGFRTETDHLQCITPFVFFGTFFDTDYQYFDDRYFAGWAEATEFKPSLKRLTAQIKMYAANTQSDLKSQRHIMLSLVEICRTPAMMGSIEELTECCRTVWPARTTRMRADVFNYWAAQTLQEAQSMGLERGDAILHGTLALYFGHQFHRDPLCPFAVKAYEELRMHTPPDLDPWRMALLDGAQHYFGARSGAKK